MNFIVRGPELGRATDCEPIIRSLPEWFGIETAIQKYLHEIAALPTFLASDDQQVVAFLTVKKHSDWAAELLVLGVCPSYHRRGIGRQLVERAEAYLQQQGVAFVQVKTLGPSRPSHAYEHTRAFYTALAYRPLEELTSVWGAENPCLILIKYIAPTAAYATRR